jgi:hypothetical protein
MAIHGNCTLALIDAQFRDLVIERSLFLCKIEAVTKPALIVIDLQHAIDHPAWRKFGERNNLYAEQNIADLLSCWRQRNWPNHHIRHDSLNPHSSYRPNQLGKYCTVLDTAQILRLFDTRG